MTRKTFILSHQQARERACQAIGQAPNDYAVTISEPTRTLEQNSLLWPLLDDVSKQVDWYGRKLASEDWKHIFSSSLRKLDVVPNLDGTGFVALGLSTSKMTKRELSDLIELIYSFGAEKGVIWSEQK